MSERRIRGSLFGQRMRARSLMPLFMLVVALGADPATADPVGQVTEFSSGLKAGSEPSVNAPGPDGNMWFTDAGCLGTGVCAIGRITPSGTITEFTSGLNPGSSPNNIAPGPDGNLWFTDVGSTKAIGRITPSGTITEFTIAIAGSSPLRIAPGPDGNMWFTDIGCVGTGVCAIGRITPSGTITEFTSFPSTGPSPAGIAAGADGNMWFADRGTPRAIGRINPSTGHIDEFHGFPIAGGKPNTITPGADGNLWFNVVGATTAIGRINPSTAVIDEFTSFPNAGSSPNAVAPGADGNVWFTDQGTTPALGRITPSGTIDQFSSGLNPGGMPARIAAGPDGNVWFTDTGCLGTGVCAIGKIGAGAPAPLQAPPTVTGAGQAGNAETCHNGQFATWAGIGPSLGLYAFDGYRWLRDGAPIAGQTGQTYTPATGDVGHQLACQVVATYPLPFLVSTPARSAAITVKPQPVLSKLRVSPHKFSLAGRRVNGRCVKPTAKNNGNQPCRRKIKLRIRYTLSTAATVSFTLKRKRPGRKVNGKCVKPTKKNNKHKHCTRRDDVPGAIVRSSTASSNGFTFNGKIGGHKLGPGTYELTATPAGGASGNATFRIVR